MDYPLFEDVILLVDLPEYGVLAGDVGVVVERHDVPNMEVGYTVEFFNLSGDTVAVVTIPASNLRRPMAVDRPVIRPVLADLTASR